MLVSVPLFLPLTVGVVAGDTIAGEAGLGTLRYLLVAPAGRIRLLLVKYAGAAVFVVVAPVTVALVGAGIGAALFPVGPVTLLSGDTIGAGEAMVRLLLIAAYLAVSLLGLSAIGLFLSTLTDVPVGAMAATVVLSVVSQVMDALPQLEWLHPWLFTHYWLDFARSAPAARGLGLLRHERPPAGRLRRRLRRAGLRPVRHQGRAFLAGNGGRAGKRRSCRDCVEGELIGVGG